MNPDRRTFLLQTAALASCSANPGWAAAQAASASVEIDPAPLFEISPHLYMQFMEPLGVADSSLEAAWDYQADDWRKDLIAATRDLAPGMVRYGGNYSRYYKWREGVGPVAARPRMRNYDWGGWETNRVGTAEFVDFCRRVGGAEPLYCVNFLSDGHKKLWATREGNRSGDAREAADWVSYCNDPEHKERRAHGAREPYNLKIWQIGNETSYGREGFPRDEAIAQTIAFAKAMRGRDPSLKLIGWGDWQRNVDESLWAEAMLERAGEHLDYIAIHMMGQRPTRPDTVLRGNRYQFHPEQAWEELLELSGNVEKRVQAIEQAAAKKPECRVAITEGHLSLPPHNINPILLEWLSAAYHARSMNIYQRHGKKVAIATCADFCGTRWTVNALLMQTPSGVSFLTPAGAVMRLFGRHNGRQGVAVKRAPQGLDIAASRTGNRYFLHVANTRYSTAVEARFAVTGAAAAGGRVFEIAPDNLRTAATQDQPAIFAPRERKLPAGPGIVWRFPAGSVSVVELETT